MRPLADMSLVPGRGVDPGTGRLVEDPSVACTWMPGQVSVGDVLRPRPGVEMLVLMYGGEPDPDLIYTYSYQDESNWAPYRPEQSWATFSADEFEVPEDGLARVVVRRADEPAVEDGTRLSELVVVEPAPRPETLAPEFFRDEARRVADRVAKLRAPGDLVLLLVSDIHWAAGCPWDDTVRNLREVASLVSPDALAQLGDLTDGLVPSQVTREIVEDLLGDLASTGVPLYGCLGNHDANYFRGNPDSLGRRERSRLYLGREDPTYLVNFPEARVRALFLDSFEPSREERYGFSLGQLVWAARALATTPRGWGVVAFSHVPLLASMHVWSERIFHGVAMRRLLQAFDRARGVTEEKNVPFLLEVFAAVRGLRPGARLWLVGDGPQRQEVERRAAELGIADAVTFWGRRDDVPALLQGMDVLVMPSLWEGLPLSLLEAQASGLPCVTSQGVSAEVDVPGCPIRHLSLDEPTDTWARAVDDYAGHRNPRGPELVRSAGFDARDCAREMARRYRGLDAVVRA